MLNKQRVKELSLSNDTARAVFDVLSMRKRNTRVTNLHKLKYDIKENGAIVDEKEYQSLFSKLEDAGVLDIIRSPGEAPKVKWKSPVMDVAMAGAKASLVEEEPVKTKTVKDTEVTASIGNLKVSGPAQEVAYLLNLISFPA